MLQNKSDVHGLVCGEVPDQRYSAGDNFVARVMRYWGLKLGLGNDGRARHDRDDREQEYS
jgi:hypothetical protein